VSLSQPHQHVVARPNAIEWAPASPKLPPGAQMARLLGNPAQPGELYVFRVKLPDGFAVAPHWHPQDEHITVISGTMMLGFGEQRNEAKMEELTAGAYAVLPKNAPHYNRMKGETILQFHGIGPYDIVYVNPNDDPSRASNRN
jgi:quercetin dioxygenase-like cupin family protein